jgi:hypothetical protein
MRSQLDERICCTGVIDRCQAHLSALRAAIPGRAEGPAGEER